MSLPGGAERNPRTDQNLRGITARLSELTALAQRALRLQDRNQSADTGKASCEFPGEAQESGVTSVSHELGRAPTRVFVTMTGNKEARFSIPDWDNPTSTTFDVRFWCPYGSPVKGQKANFTWIAIG